MCIGRTSSGGNACSWVLFLAVAATALLWGCESRETGWAGSNLEFKTVSVQTNKGRVIADSALQTHPDGRVYRWPLLLGFRTQEEKPQSRGVTWREDNRGKHVLLFGERVQAGEGAIVFLEIGTSRHSVLPDVRWDQELFSDDDRLAAFVKNVIESTDTIEAPAPTGGD